jgi:hypothetical protein
MTGPFDPGPAGMPLIDFVEVDPEVQADRYLTAIALHDLEMLPDPSARRVRPGGMLEAYRKHADRVRAAQEGDSPENLVADIPLEVWEFGG